MTAAADWTRDEFLEQCLQRPVFRLRAAAAAAQAVEAARVYRNWMIEARVPVEQVAVLATLTSLGFRVVDTNVQLDCSTEAVAPAAARAPSAWRVRAAQPADRSAVETIAAQQLTTSRFHLDPQIDATLAARVKRDWVGNFFERRRGDRLLVVDSGAGVQGFLLALERGTVGVIDLVALEPAVRGGGATAALVQAWRLAAPQLERLAVGTQLANVRSLRAYAALGFRVRTAAYVLHRHPDEAETMSRRYET